MSLSAIVMLIFGCLVLYGGLIYCIRIALKNRVKPGGRFYHGDTETRRKHT